MMFNIKYIQEICLEGIKIFTPFMDSKDVIKLLEDGNNCIVYGANNSGKTTLLKDINKYYVQKNSDAVFNNDKSRIDPCVIIPAKRVFELEDGGVLANKESLTIDTIQRFGKEWITGSYILGVREKIKESPAFRGKVTQMCSYIFETTFDDVFNTKCSDGVQNVVNVLSYIFHTLQLYSDSNDMSIILKMHFLLIVDEIELFLYTKSIVNFLDTLFLTFTNMRMLISSHSVLVMQRINNFKVLKVENIDSIIDSGLSPYYNDFGVILSSFYDIKEYPLELESLMSKMDNLLTSTETDESQLKPIFDEANCLRAKFPLLAELITNLQLNFYKRYTKNAALE